MSVDAGQSPATVRRIQPLRVLLSGPDRRFIRVTSFLLSRRGYEVVDSAPDDTVGAAERHRSDVVLLESGESRAAVARRVAQLGSLAAAPGVIVVTRGEDAFWSGLRTIEKWMPLDELVDEIEAASLHRPIPFVESGGKP